MYFVILQQYQCIGNYDCLIATETVWSGQGTRVADRVNACGSLLESIRGSVFTGEPYHSIKYTPQSVVFCQRRSWPSRRLFFSVFFPLCIIRSAFRDQVCSARAQPCQLPRATRTSQELLHHTPHAHPTMTDLAGGMQRWMNRMMTPL